MVETTLDNAKVKGILMNEKFEECQRSKRMFVMEYGSFKGVGISAGPSIYVIVESDEAAAKLPKTYDGFPVQYRTEAHRTRALMLNRGGWLQLSA